MYFKRLLYSFAAAVLVSGFVFAQDAPTASNAEKEKANAEKEKKAVAIIEDIAGQISLLKNPDNRALTLASVADLIWKRDEKRARQLFRQSADEIVASNNAPPENKSAPENIIVNFSRNSSPRADILRTIAARDAELALELLYVTRPANVAAAMASYNRSQPKSTAAQKNPADMMEQSQNRFLAESELRLEQGFSEKAAENDPQLAAKMLRESLAKNGVTTSVFGILQKINSKDNELAVKLLNEVNQKLLGETFADGENGDDSLAVQFLRQFYLDAAKSKEKKVLKLEASAAKELANKLADAFLKTDQSRSMSVYFQLRSAMSVLEKIIPERAALLKQKQETIKKSLPEEMTRFDNIFDNADSPSPEKMVDNAAKMPAQMRGFMYRNAVNEAVKDGNLDAVRASLSKAPEGKDRDDAIAYLDSKTAEKKIEDGKIDEARKIIDALGSTKEKVERLVQMAIGFQQKNTKEDKEFAVKLMTEARGLIDYSPEDEDAANDFLRIVSGYAYVEPTTAFSMLDAFADQANELVNASATVAKFDKNNPNFKNGELILTRGLPRIGGKVLDYGKEAQLLANEDIDRLQNIAGKFQRPDAQILLKLYIVQAFFTGKIGLQGAAGGDRENFFSFSFSSE